MNPSAARVPSLSTTRPSCPLCGQGFDCGASTGACWCQDLPPVDRAALPAAAEGQCLCPACLRVHAPPVPRP